MTARSEVGELITHAPLRQVVTQLINMASRTDWRVMWLPRSPSGSADAHCLLGVPDDNQVREMLCKVMKRAI